MHNLVSQGSGWCDLQSLRGGNPAKALDRQKCFYGASDVQVLELGDGYTDVHYIVKLSTCVLYNFYMYVINYTQHLFGSFRTLGFNEKQLFTTYPMLTWNESTTYTATMAVWHGTCSGVSKDDAIHLLLLLLINNYHYYYFSFEILDLKRALSSVTEWERAQVSLSEYIISAPRMFD